MQNFAIATLPKGVQDALMVGLGSLKVATKTDKVSVVSNEVGTPVIAPEGSPLTGQVARPQGAPTEPFVALIIDTSAFNESVTDIQCTLGDGTGVHRNGCFNCAGSSSNTVTPYIQSPTCNLYETFLNKLCSRPYTFGAAKVEVRKAATNSTAGSVMELPQSIQYSRKNINGDGTTGTVQISLYEQDENYPNPNKRYTTVALQNEAALFDSDTQWTLNNLQGGRVYTIILFTGVQG
jgi:hypothetical protein